MRAATPKLLGLLACHCVTLTACAARERDDEGGGEPAARYQQVAQIIERSCAKQTCHGELSMNARLNFMQPNVWQQLVGVPACEYSKLQRVEPGAPERSWLMLKLAGPVRFRQYANFIDFTPDPTWQANADCAGPAFDDGAAWFGTPMPPPDTTSIAPDDIEVIRAWIEDGAKH